MLKPLIRFNRFWQVLEHLDVAQEKLAHAAMPVNRRNLNVTFVAPCSGDFRCRPEVIPQVPPDERPAYVPPKQVIAEC
jgi:hypothetical protein